jgi:hypothetical protein
MGSAGGSTSMALSPSVLTGGGAWALAVVTVFFFSSVMSSSVVSGSRYPSGFPGPLIGGAGATSGTGGAWIGSTLIAGPAGSSCSFGVRSEHDAKMRGRGQRRRNFTENRGCPTRVTLKDTGSNAEKLSLPWLRIPLWIFCEPGRRRNCRLLGRPWGLPCFRRRCPRCR